MNREIKFRAWDTENKKWREIESIAIARNDMPTNISATDGRTYQIQSNGQIVLSQYTGLKDKNGNEIYEGDIVKWHNSYDKEKEGMAEIIWDEDSWVASVEKTNGIDFYSYDGREFSWDELEIIGNIYENPELIDTN